MFATTKALNRRLVSSSYNTWNRNLRPSVGSFARQSASTACDDYDEIEISGDRKFASQLEKDALSFFRREREGNLWPYLYGAPEHEGDKVDGGRYYLEAVRNVPEYYLHEGESQLFRSQSSRIAEVVGPGATVIELGPGSAESVSLKTVPLLKALSDLKGYMGIDISLEFLEKALDTVRDSVPSDVMVQGHQQDFSKLSCLTTEKSIENPVILFKGSTIGNLRASELSDFISQVPRLVGGQKHYFLVVHDCNQDVDSLMKAYHNRRHSKFCHNVMYRLERDADCVNFNPSQFKYTPAYDPVTYDFAHYVSATHDQTVDLGDGEQVSVQAGDKFKTLSSHKYPVSVFQDMVSKTGAYEPLDVVMDASGRMVCHILESK